MTRLDVLLVVMVLIWGANFSLVKVALVDFPELAFNACRLAIASTIMLSALWWTNRQSREAVHAIEPTTITGADWRRLALLGTVGHLLYQVLFLGGIKRTSVANGSLIVGTTPVLVALFTAFAGHERVSRLRWVGAVVSFLGLYIVVGRGTAWTGASHFGDAMVVASACCWAIYSVASVPLLKRHSPLVVTGGSMTIGAVLYVVFASPALVGVDWSAISTRSWVLMTLSATFALAFSYLIWYTSVQRAGTTRTAAWSNVTPIAAAVIAAFWLGEPITANQVVGSLAIFTGLFITRRT
jgi:drug/metabolite transporter (DMT)-like permease